MKMVCLHPRLKNKNLKKNFFMMSRYLCLQRLAFFFFFALPLSVFTDPFPSFGLVSSFPFNLRDYLGSSSSSSSPLQKSYIEFTCILSFVIRCIIYILYMLASCTCFFPFSYQMPKSQKGFMNNLTLHFRTAPKCCYVICI